MEKQQLTEANMSLYNLRERLFNNNVSNFDVHYQNTEEQEVTKLC